MSPLPIHERSAGVIGRLIEMYTFERDLPCQLGGSTTFKLAEKERGLEPDKCYWIQHAPQIRGREYDPESDPPPDLAVEVDITSSSLPRMSIYADLRVPEIWRYKNGVVTIHLLRETGEYVESDVGQALPALTPEVITRFLTLQTELDDTDLLKAFVRWIREEETPAKKPRRRHKG